MTAAGEANAVHPSAAANIKYPPSASSVGLGWEHLLVAEYRNKPDGEVQLPALTHHFLLLNLNGGAASSVSTGGAERSWRPHPGSITLVPAGASARWAWRGCPDTMLFLLDAEAVSHVALTDFGLDPARVALDPLRDVHDAPMLSVLAAIRSELHAGGVGSALCVESLRTVLAVYLLRRFSGGLRLDRRTGRLPPRLVQRVVTFVEDNLADGLTLSALAQEVGLSVYHFARQFKATTGVTPHGYVLTRRIERAKLLLPGADSVAAVAAEVGFSDQSHFTRHFKRLVGVTPTNFR